jgi:AbrB family looped-hinge helix DNA binding protein
METTRLSSKGQVIIPKAIRTTHRWQAGLDLMVIDTGDGILLKPKAPFIGTVLADVAGMFKARVAKRSDAEIKAALNAAIKRQWRGRG